MNISMIYDNSGQAEYTVVPIMIWQKLNEYLKNEHVVESKQTHVQFNPSDFKGILCQSNLDTELEISLLRKEE